MKVLTIAGDALVEPLGGEPDIEQFVLAAPSNVARFSRLAHVGKVFPYRPLAKLNLQAVRGVRKAIRAVQPDLIHGLFGRPLAHAVLATAGMRSPPPLVSYRGISTAPSRLDPADRITYLHRRIAAHACESRATARGLIAAGVPPERCFVTYRYTPPPKSRPGRDALLPWGVPEDAFVIATLGTFRPVKGADVLLRAALECQDLKDTYWVLIGPVSDRAVQELAEDSRIRDRVRCLGYQRGGAELVGAADLFVMASRADAVPSALFEAMWHRVCPIVTAVGGMPEVVRHDQCGLVVPSEDPATLATAIRRLYADSSRRAELAQAAQRRVEVDFTPAAFARRIADIYRRVIHKPADLAAA